MFPPGFTCPAVLWIQLALLSFRLRDSHPLWCAFPHTSTNFKLTIRCPKPQWYFYLWFGLLRFRSPLLSESLLFSFPPGTKMFQFPGFSPHKLCIGLWVTALFNAAGFPHSDTPGSLSVYDSPRRFAVNCVLLLLYMPRHPPYALFRLITKPKFFFFVRELLSKSVSFRL